MFTERDLPRDEWDRLIGWPVYWLMPWLKALDEDQVIIHVVEHEGEIIATQALFAMAHLEGLTVREDFRKHTAPQRMLWRWVAAVTRDRDGVMTAADTPEVEAIIRKLGGVEWPVKPFLLPLRGVVESTSTTEGS